MLSAGEPALPVIGQRQQAVPGPVTLSWAARSPGSFRWPRPAGTAWTSIARWLAVR